MVLIDEEQGISREAADLTCKGDVGQACTKDLEILLGESGPMGETPLSNPLVIQGPCDAVPGCETFWRDNNL